MEEVADGGRREGDVEAEDDRGSSEEMELAWRGEGGEQRRVEIGGRAELMGRWMESSGGWSMAARS